MNSAADAGRDRLAVWDQDEHGEQVVTGEWSVSDAERLAAGRPTLTGRFRELLPANRARAARQYADRGLPAGQEMIRVWFSRDAAALAARLGGQPLAAWADGDVLHVLWRGEAERAALIGGISVPLWPVEGAAGLWEASVRVRRLDEAVISLAVAAAGPGGPLFGPPPGQEVVFAGPRAPAPVPERPLAGELHKCVLDSAALGGPRPVTVYLPPGAGGGGTLPACALADGQSVILFAAALEAAVRAGTAPPVILVGVHHAPASAAARSRQPDLRSLEYLPQLRSRRFPAHLSFVADEVVPWAAGRFPVAPGPWTAAGFSNGAVWAITAAQRRPDRFGRVAAFSAGLVPGRIARQSQPVRHYLAAGTLEPGFRRQTSAWAARLERAGMACVYREWAGGHDDWWWRAQLPPALAWLHAG
jgi:enterochelin esterase-like enzyme